VQREKLFPSLRSAATGGFLRCRLAPECGALRQKSKQPMFDGVVFGVVEIAALSLAALAGEAPHL
jgi:hypothetical protein